MAKTSAPPFAAPCCAREFGLNSLPRNGRQIADCAAMHHAQSVLCPIDFSEGSRGALRYAGAIAAHAGARLTLLAVNDPLLREAAELTGGQAHLVDDTTREMERFYRLSLGDRAADVSDVQFAVASGKPAPEILRVSHERGCDLIVMASHGATGFRKLFFGSTTERVLRETTVPMLVTPGGDPGPVGFDDLTKLVRRVLVPVDLSAATLHQLVIARGLSEALTVPLLLLHVIEPVRSVVAAHATFPTVEAERRFRVESELERVTFAMSAGTKPEALVAYGEPSEEIAKIASDRDAGLIVMGLHSSPVLGPRMGSVTYRALCLAHRLLLALPPEPADAVSLGASRPARRPVSTPAPIAQ
jgi:nucleotide-binding universal stress UspA family protein